jgi:hypothetical protein
MLLSEVIAVLSENHSRHLWTNAKLHSVTADVTCSRQSILRGRSAGTFVNVAPIEEEAKIISGL